MSIKAALQCSKQSLLTMVMMVGLMSAGFAADPFTSNLDAYPEDEQEQRVWDLSRSLEQDLHRKNKVRPVSQLDTYLISVLNKLFPEFSGSMRIKVLAQPEVNAYTTAAGTIFITEGLLARLDNEAQLAAVLAHEGIHFIHRHAATLADRERIGDTAQSIAKNLVSSANPFAKLGVGNLAESMFGAAKGLVFDRVKDIADDNVVGTAKQQYETFKKDIQKSLSNSIAGIRPDGFASTSLFGFSAGFEKEADELGFKRVVQAGYDPHEAVKLFKMLGEEMKRRNKSEFYFFSSIAMLSERETAFEDLSKHTTQIFKGEHAFQTAVGAIKVESIQREISLGRYDALLNFFAGTKGQERLKHATPTIRFYLGEAYRIRANEHDLELALEQYNMVLDAIPNHFAAQRSKGIVLAWQGNRDDAITWIQRSIDNCDIEWEQSFSKQLLDIFGQEKLVPNKVISNLVAD